MSDRIEHPAWLTIANDDGRLRLWCLKEEEPDETQESMQEGVDMLYGPGFRTIVSGKMILVVATVAEPEDSTT